MPRGPKPLKKKLKVDEFYCVKCRARVKGSDLYIKTYRNRKVGSVPMLKGSCNKCGQTTVNKIVKKSAVAGLKKKFM